MAKALTTQPPSSSVARLLDSSAATRAIAGRPRFSSDTKQLDTERAFIRTSVPQNVPRSHKRELSLCPASDRILETLVHRLRSNTGTRVTASHVIRAMLRSMETLAGSIEESVARAGPWRMPATSPDAREHREAFDRALASVFREAAKQEGCCDSGVAGPTSQWPR